MEWSIRPNRKPYPMLLKRVLVVVLLLPVGLAAIYLGGLTFTGLIALIMVLAAREYVTLFRASGQEPSRVLVLGGVLLIVLGRSYNGFESGALMISLLLLASMAHHLFRYERGRDHSGTDFGVTVAGFLYIGWIGAYLVSMRALPEGIGWLLLVLLAVWFVDSGAYLIGSRYGRRSLSKRLSPRKTWEGYLGGVAFGIFGGALFGAIIMSLSAPDTAITPVRGAILGLLMGSFTILGDLGESMIKRQAGLKDSGNLLPGHGGVFDRIDSWLWAGVIGYYAILLFTSI
jgi:phosphatidate cytidylyltransferase